MRDVYLTPTLSLIELIYLFIVTPGWLAALRGFWLAWGDVCAVKKAQQAQGALQVESEEGRLLLLVARMGLWLHLGAFAACTFFLLLGIQTVTAPPPTDVARGPVTVFYFLVYMGLVVIKNAATVIVDRMRAEITNGGRGTPRP